MSNQDLKLKDENLKKSLELIEELFTLLKDNEYSIFMSRNLFSIKFELERQLSLINYDSGGH